MAFDVGSAVGYLTLDISGLTQGFTEASKQMQQFEQEEISTADKLGAVGGALTGIGTAMVGAVGAVGTASVMLATNFDASMSNVQAISGATAEDMELLEAEARRMGSITKFSATEAADAFSYMAMAGWETENMLEGLEGILYLAGASGTDLATTSDIVTDALTAFGYTAADTSMFVDVLAAASSAANTNVVMLGESFQYVAPVAGSLGYNAQDTAIALGLMANAGIKASQGGTVLRTVLNNMINPTATMKEAMEALGVSLTDDEGNMYSLLEIMDNLRVGFQGGANSSDPFIAKMQELSDALAQGVITQEEYDNALVALTENTDLLSKSQLGQYASMLAGREGMSGLLAIVNASEEDYNKLVDAIYNSNDAAMDMYNIMQDNLAGSLAELKSGIEEAGISIGQALTPMISDLAQKLKDAVAWFNDLSDSDKELIVQIGLAIGAIGGLLVIFGTLATSIAGIMGLVEALGGMGTIISALTGPLGIAIAAVAALALAWTTNFGGIRDKTQEIFDSLSRIFSTGKERLQGFIDTIVDALGVAFDWIETTFSDLLTLISDIFAIFADLFTGDWEKLGEDVKKLFSDFVNAILDFFGGLLDTVITLLLGFAVDIFFAAQNAFDRFWSGAMEILNAFLEWFTLFLQDPLAAIKALDQAFKDAGRDLIEFLWNGIQEAWNNFIGWFQEKLDWLQEKIMFWKSASDTVSGSSLGDRFGLTGETKSTSTSSNGLIYDTSSSGTSNSSTTTAKGNTTSQTVTNTYNFYSPEALTPTKAASEFKRVQQELALGMARG